jgi:hypothetical protein
MAANCQIGVHGDKRFTPSLGHKELYEGPGSHDRKDDYFNSFRKPRGYRDTAIMFFKGCLLVQALLIVFYKINPIIAAPPHSRQNALSNLHPDSWQKYVRAPSSNIIKPVRIVSSYPTGGAKNPNGLIDGSGTTLTRRPASGNATTAAGRPIADTQPELIVDFGQNYAGVLSINFGGASNSTPGFPGIRLAFSETLQYLSNYSDFSRSNNVSVNVTSISNIKANTVLGRHNYSRLRSSECNIQLHMDPAHVI